MGRAQRSRNNRRQQGASKGLPGWAMLTIGLIIGLFVAFLVYLDDLDEPPRTAVERTPDTSEPTDGERQADDGDEDDKPEFEFYSILPELEVVVPEGERTGKDDADAGSGDAGGGGDDAEPVPGEGETFYLQAGSFQEADQADRMKARIALLGLDVAIQDVEINGEQWHRVRVGPYTDPAELRAAQKRLRSKDIDYLVLREKSGAG